MLLSDYLDIEASLGSVSPFNLDVVIFGIERSNRPQERAGQRKARNATLPLSSFFYAWPLLNEISLPIGTRSLFLSFLSALIQKRRGPVEPKP